MTLGSLPFAPPRTVSFTVPGQPRGKGRPIAGKSFAGYTTLRTPEKTVAYEGLIAICAQQAMAGRPLIEGPVFVSMTMACQIPASWSTRKKQQAEVGNIKPATKPDADNCVKAMFDAMNGVVWKDDVQVCELNLAKIYCSTPGVSVYVKALDAA